MPATRFRAPPPDALIVHPLEDLTAVYHRASGTTHILAPPAPEILVLLGTESMTRDALLAALAAEFDLVDAAADLLDARLEELVAAGLVQPL